MYQAKILHEQGIKKWRIAEILDVDRRTVYNYLNGQVFQTGAPLAGRPEGSPKLSPFYAFIEQQLETDLYVSGDLLCAKLHSMGYAGQKTIFYEHLKKRREELLAYAVLRYETVAGQQAQVDWAECGSVWENGMRKKRYCFVMKLGYSRRSYMEFTTSMKQPILFACMKRAFEYFGGIPREILFDNMKTAFIYDHEQGKWVAHPKMLAFAAHYGFAPRRCRVRRPQTKGKVEREIRYLRSSFFPGLRLEGVDVSAMRTAELNKQVLLWLRRVDGKVLRELGATRMERFKADLAALKALPVDAFDHRVQEPLKVSLEGIIRFQGNQYGIDARYRGKMLDGRWDPDANLMSIYHEGREIKMLRLFPEHAGRQNIEPADRQSLLAAWEEDRDRYEKRWQRRVTAKKHKAEMENAVVNPVVYDEIFGIAAPKLEGVAA